MTKHTHTKKKLIKTQTVKHEDLLKWYIDNVRILLSSPVKTCSVWTFGELWSHFFLFILCVRGFIWTLAVSCLILVADLKK